MSDEETEQDMFMYVLEAMAYISASLAAIIYIWDTCFKEFKKRKIRRNDNRDLEMGLTPINENQEEKWKKYDDLIQQFISSHDQSLEDLQKAVEEFLEDE